MSDARNANNCPYGEPIYAMPVKPFLSTQDVRNAAVRQFQRPELLGAGTTTTTSMAGCRPATGYCGKAVVSAAGLTVQGTRRFESAADKVCG